MADEVAALMADRLRIRGSGLAEKLRHSRRVLPRRIRQEAEMLARAAYQTQVPKLAHQLDRVRIEKAHAACLKYLKPLGATERTKDLVLAMMGGIALAVLGTFALVVTVLVWRGYL
ncbi:hypothetical protein [Ostreiculturibacter nitratireducens]|uniref:hypothetical protein n=1 Tax=Ostreiculturibacter nitratireducens TaxID=3075226 RepID=UPI0031B58031